MNCRYKVLWDDFLSPRIVRAEGGVLFGDAKMEARIEIRRRINRLREAHTRIYRMRVKDVKE